MRSVEMKNRCLLYYGNPVGYRTEQGVVADSMFRREELEDWLARKGLAVRWEDGIYDRLSSGGYQKAADNGPALKSCRIWQLGPSAPAAMRFIGLDRMSGEYGGPDLTRYQAVFDGTVSTNSLDGIWEAFCRRSLGSDGQPLAISDLVELYDDSGSEFYYVDRTAIVPVQLKAPEQESGMTMPLCPKSGKATYFLYSEKEEPTMAKAQTTSENPQGEVSQQDTPVLPMQYDVRIHSIQFDGPCRATASLNINGCFAVRGVKLMEGSNGLFVSMPGQINSKGEIKDICFPYTREARAELESAVVTAYQQALTQGMNRSPQSAPDPTAQQAQKMGM